jgi:lipopolysaccharide export LptBFGC system permease protein LptF
MNKLDWYVLKSYVRPLLPTVGIMVFFFLMQMVWKYVDDLAGKGIEWYVLLELMMYWAASVVPFALPVSVLFASLLTFGNFGEHYEMAAMKSSGISLFRGIRSLIILNIGIAIGAFYFYNDVIPVANLKGQSLLINIPRASLPFTSHRVFFTMASKATRSRLGKNQAMESRSFKTFTYTTTKRIKKETRKSLPLPVESCVRWPTTNTWRSNCTTGPPTKIL